MSPEVRAALIGGVATITAAVIALIPAVLAILRRQRGTVERDGEATREAVVALGASVHARVDALRDELRSDVSTLDGKIDRVREWQAGHDAEHLLLGRHPNSPES